MGFVDPLVKPPTFAQNIIKFNYWDPNYQAATVLSAGSRRMISDRMSVSIQLRFRSPGFPLKSASPNTREYGSEDCL